MLIGVPQETVPGETPVAAMPATAKKLRGQGRVLRARLVPAWLRPQQTTPTPPAAQDSRPRACLGLQAMRSGPLCASRSGKAWRCRRAGRISPTTWP